jgi:hypothetical protein
MISQRPDPQALVQNMLCNYALGYEMRAFANLPSRNCAPTKPIWGAAGTFGIIGPIATLAQSAEQPLRKW